MIALLVAALTAMPAPAAPPAPVNAVLGDASWDALRPGDPLDEAARITTHLSYVEALLRAAPTDALSPSQREGRAAVLDRLRTYRAQARFPRNTHSPRRAPVFVDAEGRRCAVAALAEPDVGAALIEDIAARQRLAYIEEIDAPPLRRWAEANGLTLRELAMIQPTYRPPLLIERKPGPVRPRAQTRLEHDWAVCAGSAYAGNALTELPRYEATVTFYPMDGMLAGRVRLSGPPPPDEDAAARRDRFIVCLTGSFANRRFIAADDVQIGKPYPLTTPAFDGPRILPDGKLAPGPAAAILHFGATTQLGCVPSDAPGGRWRLRLEVGADGQVGAASATPADTPPGAEKVTACVQQSLPATLGHVFPPSKGGATIEALVALGQPADEIEVRQDDSMAHEPRTLTRAEQALQDDQWRCAVKRYPAETTLPARLDARVTFALDGRRVAGTLDLKPAGGAAPDARDAKFIACVTEAFARRRFDLHDVWPGEPYPLGWAVIAADPVEAGALAVEPLRHHLERRAAAIIRACPALAEAPRAWTLQVWTGPRQTPRFVVTAAPDPNLGPARKCLERHLNRAIKLPRVSKATTIELHIAPGAPNADPTLPPDR